MAHPYLPGQDGRVAELMVTNAGLRERNERLAAALRACVLELEWFAPGRAATLHGRAELAAQADEGFALAALTGLQVTELTPETVCLGSAL